MVVAGRGSTPGLEGSFSAQLVHVMRLNTRTGTEGLPVSSIDC